MGIEFARMLELFPIRSLRIEARLHFIEKQQRHGYTGKVRK